jgi:hypothetical protein
LGQGTLLCKAAFGPQLVDTQRDVFLPCIFLLCGASTATLDHQTVDNCFRVPLATCSKPIFPVEPLTRRLAGIIRPAAQTGSNGRHGGLKNQSGGMPWPQPRGARTEPDVSHGMVSELSWPSGGAHVECPHAPVSRIPRAQTRYMCTTGSRLDSHQGQASMCSSWCRSAKTRFDMPRSWTCAIRCYEACGGRQRSGGGR